MFVIKKLTKMYFLDTSSEYISVAKIRVYFI